MSEQVVTQVKPQTTYAVPISSSHGVLQRCSNGVECEECRKKRESSLQRAAVSAAPTNGVPPIVHEVLSSSGQPLDVSARTFMESRFGHDFSGVRVHTGERAAESARSVNALAYTVGRDVVFGTGQYSPGTMVGKRLLAHELTHVVQQRQIPTTLHTKLEVGEAGGLYEQEAHMIAERFMAEQDLSPMRVAPGLRSPLLQRACLSAAVCAAPVPGSAEEFSASESAVEAPARAARAALPPAAAAAGGHGGHARQLERFVDGQTPGLRGKIHGIFIDQDLSLGTGALTRPCASFVPPILGATKPCMFVPGSLNQQALAFNTSPSPTIGGMPREDWRVQTLQSLTHEIQHVVYDTTPHAALPGVACSRTDVEDELSELNAIMSEFPIAFRAIPPGAGPADPSRTRLADWFTFKITNPKESIQGALKKLRCKCSCPDADKYIKDTFNFVSASWTLAEKAAFNAELKKPVWSLSWPL
jgi:hypothetical protein